ncbi:HAD family hydrolase [Robertkochia flava]|uniref:HAD family hydrolase n=1 Tax=Robertkochia flava TaxID=3447986 RepID=UPI001CCC1FD3|nr:HAD family hydrolase [Robertkochia marina]
MQLDKVRLVVSDMDGTLLNSRGQVSERFFELYHGLKDHVHFVAASGRQYHSIRHKLERISDQITIVAENGGMARNAQEELLFTGLPAKHLSKIIEKVRPLNNAEIILCGKNGAFIENDDPNFIDIFREYYHQFEITRDLSQVDPSEIMKVAIYHQEDSEKHVYPHVEELNGDLLVKVSGKHWVDISHPDANKGRAVKLIQAHMGIGMEETMVFGDYNNDLEMLEQGYFSYAMQNAHPNVKEIARYTTQSNDEEGEESILELLLQAKTSA